MTPSSTTSPTTSATHAAFLLILPQIEALARAAFWMIPRAHDLDDAVAEVVARTWEFFVASPTYSAEQLAVPVIAQLRRQLTCPTC